ncbi:MAG: hypothetical protein OXB98_15075 [Bryobacterales bacterium]|nr:hypothetical protein [Bryobacterales bacterium]
MQRQGRHAQHTGDTGGPGAAGLLVAQQLAAAARTLRWIVGALILVLLITSIGWVRSASHDPQPLFVRVDDVGRAEFVNYEALQFDKNPVCPSPSSSSLDSFATTTSGEDAASARPGHGACTF